MAGAKVYHAIMANDTQKNSLVIFTQAARMLAEADTIQKAKELKDLALTAADWAKRKGMGEEAIQYARSYALEAERRMGEMLRVTRLADGGDAQRTRYHKSTESPPTLAELGLSKRDSSEAQMLADLPAEDFEKIKSGEISKAKVKKQKNIQVRHARHVAETKAALSEKPVIIQADCMDIVPAVQPIDLLITDPPYFTNGDFTRHVSTYLAKVKATGQAYVFASADPAEISSYLMMDSKPLHLEQVLVWNYNNTGQRQPNTRYNSNYQLIFYYRGPDAPPLNKPSDGTHQYACQTINAPDARLGDRFHEWQKPLELIERFIRNSSRPGEFIFDPFAGSGTTILAAAKLGRKAKGCDIDAGAVQICRERGCIDDL